ncbi:hypothetical protein H4R34_001645 [Dimargaris verticillata]|uniref:Kinase n=1 Tax=Dimargaris verticillata TaxID=2761393 RepID=A0A9W8B5Q2_9FUNG|nr:hypothetical protein H4R34_001645 [Dimargaris verticillata]
MKATLLVASVFLALATLQAVSAQGQSGSHLDNVDNDADQGADDDSQGVDGDDGQYDPQDLDDSDDGDMVYRRQFMPADMVDNDHYYGYAKRDPVIMERRGFGGIGGAGYGAGAGTGFGGAFGIPTIFVHENRFRAKKQKLQKRTDNPASMAAPASSSTSSSPSSDNRPSLQPRLWLPDGQVAGHGDVDMAPGSPWITKKCNQQEKEFYEHAADHPHLASFLPRLKEIAPRSPTNHSGFYEPLRTTYYQYRPSRDKPFLLTIENLGYSFTHPSVLDLKLGHVLYEDNASAIKKGRMKLISRMTTSRTLGICISGMRVYDTQRQEYIRYGRSYGRWQRPSTIDHAFQNYFPPSLPTAYRDFLATQFAASIQKLISIFDSQRWHIYGSSLLFVYEGDVAKWDCYLAQHPTTPTTTKISPTHSANSRETPALLTPPLSSDSAPQGPSVTLSPDDLCALRLIDFAHASWSLDDDTRGNMLTGLVNTQQLLLNLLSGL